VPINDPRDISGLVLWYSAEAETAYSNGASMTGWTDLSGNGNHATAQGTLAPHWQSTTGSSGGAAVRFRGTHGSTSATWGYFSLPANVMGSAAAGEIHASLKSDGADCSLWGLGLASGNSAASHYPFSGDIYESFGTASRKPVGTPDVAITSWRRYNVWSASGDWSARINATVEFSTASNTVLWDAAPTIGHGKRQSALSTNIGSFQGHMGAVILYNRKLTTTERNDLDAWLAAHPSGGTVVVPDPTVNLAGTLTAPAWTLDGTFDLDPAPVVYDLDLDSTLTAPSWTLDGDFGPDPHAELDVAGSIVAPTWEVDGSFAIAVPLPSDLALTGVLAAPDWDLAGGFDLDVTPLPAGLDLAGTLGAPEWTLAGAFTLAAETDNPLAEFVSLYDSTELNGSGHLVETGVDPSMLFILPSIVLDPATTYTVTVDFINAVGDSRISLYSSLGTTQVDADASQWFALADYSEGFGTPSGTLGETGPFEFTIGPGIADWADAVTAGEQYVIFQLNNMDVTGITVVDASTPDPVGSDAGNDAHKLTLSGWGVVAWEPAIVPAPFVGVRHSVISAIAYGPVTMQGTQPVFTYSEADAPRLRQRILFGGRDATYDRGVPVPDVEYELSDVLLYGPGSLSLPAFMAAWEIGTDAMSRVRDGARVKVQLVDDFTDAESPVVEATVYKGFVMNRGVSGRHMALELGGEAQGRLTLRDSHVLFRDVLDISRLLWALLRDVGIRYLPRLGDPGLGIRSLNFGGQSKYEKFQELLVRAIKKDGTQRAVLPDSDGIYRPLDKDTTTKHFSVFVDDAFTVLDVDSDIAEKPNTIYPTAVAPNGRRIDGAAVAGLISTPAPPYPMDDDSYFGIGTTNEDTDTGDGITVMVRRLGAVGLLTVDDAPGGFDQDVADALDKVGRRARATAPVGTMTPDLWAALWDLDVVGRSRKWASIEPAAQDPAVQRYKRAASGAVIGLNPDYDPDAIQVDESIDMGTGIRERQVDNWAQTRVHAPDEKVWYGQITLNLGAVLAGQVDVGDTITAADLVDARLVQPGRHNLWVPNFDGGTLFGVSGAQVNGDSLVFTVDTRHRPAREIWERRQVRRETRSDPARRAMGTRQSTLSKDAVHGFISWGGILDRDVDLVAGWNKVELVVGDYGTLARFRTVVQDISGTGGDVVITGHEHAVAVFGRPPSGNTMTVARMNDAVPAPLAENGDRPYRRRATRKVLNAHGFIEAWGTHDEPAGYGGDLKTDDAPLTGVEDVTDVPFEGIDGYRLDVFVWVAAPTTLRAGRMGWPLLESGI
jgi:hypothetical protein